jgi:GNAT superfamily N-acetyltransferase
MNGIGEWNGKRTAFDIFTGVEKGYRRRGLATNLLNALMSYAESNKIKIINSAASDKPFKAFVRSIKMVPGPGQFEMVLKLQ